MMRIARCLLGWGLVLAGCSSSAGPGTTDLGSRTPCVTTPTACPAGETCWFVDTAAAEYECRRTTAFTQPGDRCTPSVAVPTCSAGQLCVGSATGATTFVCTAYCDPNVAGTCGGTAQCTVQAFSGGPSLPLCPVTSAIADAGPG